MDTKYTRYKRYDDDFKRSAIELLDSTGRPIAEIAGDLGIPYKTLERWRYQMRGRNRKPPAANEAPPDPQALELKALRKKLADVQMERDILKKALAICSREANSNGGSN
jgi:transposase-like protein